MIFPKKLRPGNRVALLSASGPVEPERLEPAAEAVQRLGLEPVLYPSCRARRGYLAGSDELRAKDVMDAFLDDTIDGVWCIRGGYGAHRLMKHLDLAAIAAHPKFFGGYSDVTALNTAFNDFCGFVTYHMPMASTEVYKPLDDYTMDALKRALTGSLAGPWENPPERPLETLCPGEARGRLAGGNLSLVVATLGTPYEIDTRDKLLFLEDIGEEPYRVDGMLQHLASAGKLDQAAGIVLGYFTDCQDSQPEKSLSLREVFEDHVASTGKPALMELACGHDLPTGCLPLGARAEMDAAQGRLILLEDANG